jgi:hypothetical protein
MSGKIKTLFFAFAFLVSPFGAWADDDSSTMSMPIMMFIPDPPESSTLNYQTAANRILDILTFRYSDEKGNISYPELYNALGALAGFGCQEAVNESFVTTGIIKENIAFYIYTPTNRSRYFLSALVDAEMFGNDKVKTSVNSLVSGAAEQAGAKVFPDLKEISAYNFKTMGTPDFGIPRVTKKYKEIETPVGILDRNWVPMRRILDANKVDPKLWGWTFALAAHDIILKHPHAFDPSLAAEIVMESATPMSTIDPASLILKQK